jgi:citrate synthase
MLRTENFVADTTSVSYVDGDAGKLFYRGLDVEELAFRSTFEECCYLLFFGHLPTHEKLSSFCWKLKNSFKTPEKIIRIVLEQPKHASILPVLQTCLSAMSCLDPIQSQIQSLENVLDKCIRIVSLTSSIVARSYRHKLSEANILLRSDLNFVESFLYLINGKKPSPEKLNLLEIALICQMEHGFNSSTFTARTVASTLATPYSACSAAIGALSGPLHGGACLEVFSFTKKLRESLNIENDLKNLVNFGIYDDKIPGTGHRIYKKIDPRAKIFESLILNYIHKNPSKNFIKQDYINLKKVEHLLPSIFRQEHAFVSLDYWSALLYQCIGIPVPVFPAVFAAARIVGWVSHILELRLNNKLYRPNLEYTGKCNQSYVPISERE